MKKRVISMLLSVLMIFSLVPVSVFADGTGTTGGRVTLTKKLVSKVPDENGYYTLELTVSGTKTTQEIGGTAGDIILVIDNSGSMSDHVGAGTCAITGAQIKVSTPSVNTEYWGTEKVYTCKCGHRYTEYYFGDAETPYWSDLPDDTTACGRKTSGTPRMDIAKDVAKQFAEYVLTTAEGSKIAVIGFAGSNGGTNDTTAIKVTSGLSSDLISINSKIDGMVANGGTNYTAALSAANSMLDDREDKTRPGYVIFLTDGAPGRSGNSLDSTDWNGSYQAAAIKEEYTLFTIGILLDPEDESAAISHLESLATPSTTDEDGNTIEHFINLDDESTLKDELRDILEQWAKDIVELLAGTEAVLTDVVSDDFKIVAVEDADAKVEGQTVTWAIGDITEKPKTIEIKIKPNDGLSGTVPTNGECELTYKDPSGATKTESAASPELEFVKINVTKKWNVEDGATLPGKVTVGLNADRAETGKTIELNADNTDSDGNWTGSFSSLPKDKLVGEKYQEIEYSLYELNVEGYTENIGELTAVDGSESEYSCTITNTPDEPDTRHITVTKVWNDADNQDGKRPDSVEIHIINEKTGGHLGSPVSLTKANASEDNANVWSAEVSIPNDGSTFILKEEGEQDGLNGVYTVSYSYDGTNYTVTNTYIPETYEYINVEKIWDDDNDKAGFRPDSIIVRLWANGEEIASRTVTEDYGWEVIFYADEDLPLPKYENGELIAYTVTEDELDTTAEYGTEITGDAVNGFEVRNYYPAVEHPAITVTKEWVDNNNQDGIRPGKVTIQLLANGDVEQTAELTGDNWSYTFTDLPMYRGGAKIVYTVDEVAVVGYTTAITGSADTGFTITNTHEPATYDDDTDDGYGPITVTKVWNDDKNNDGKRPASITVTLYADGEATDETVTLSEANGWTAAFDAVPVKANGDEIEYSVKEDTLPEGYTAGTPVLDTKSENEVTSLEFTITNTYTTETTSVAVTKVWDDVNNQDGFRPDEIIVTLYKGTSENRTSTEETVTLNERNDWSGKFENLPVYEGGKEIVYTVDENEFTYFEKYSKTITGSAADGYTITNKHTPATYDDDTDDGYGPITVTKVWEDSNNNDGKRPASITVTLYADGEATDETVTLSEANDWTAKFDAVSVYANGDEITYSVKEGTLPEGYTAGTPALEKKTENGVTSLAFTVTNTRTPETVDITVEKKWEHTSSDGEHTNDQSDYPQSVTVHLLINNEHAGETYKRTLNEENKWRTSWEMPKYANGVEIDYSVVEEAVNNYSETYSVDGNKITITNTYSPGLTTATVEKVWADADNQDGKRPASVTVKLLMNGERTKNILELSQQNHWRGTFVNLDVTKTYSVEELDTPNGYTSNVITLTHNDFTITNTYTPAKYDDNPADGYGPITVTKVWNDGDNQDGLRPESITVTLYANGEATDKTVTLSAENNWTDKFDAVPVYAAGAAIVYSVTEAELPEGYTATHVLEANIENNVTSLNFTVTNKHTPADYDDPTKDPDGDDGFEALTVTKIWDDANNQDGIRPEEITISLVKSGETLETLKVTGDMAQNEWSGAFTGSYPVYENGKAIEYTIVEDKIDDDYDYTPKSPITVHNDDNETIKGFMITNEHTPAMYDEDISDDYGPITVTKVWRDDHNRDGKRPEYIEITLYARYADVEKKEIDSITLSGESNAETWSGEFTNVPVFVNGEEIEYSIAETPVDDYLTPEYEGDAVNGFTVTNGRYPEKINEITVTKVWDDDNNRDGLRPDYVTIHLLDSNNKEVKQATATADNGWKVVFADLYKYESGGEEIKWSVVEDSVENYESGDITGSVADGFKITNSYTPGRTSLTVVKQWDDADNQDGIRPDAVEVRLLKLSDGEYVPVKDNNGNDVTHILHKDNHWMTIFNNLYMMENGEEIIYGAEEVGIPEGYKSDSLVPYSGAQWVINNTHVPADYDDDDDDGYEPITVTKLWSDDEAYHAYQPEDIEVKLLKVTGEGNIPVDTVILSEDNDWTAAFGSQPVFENGKKVEYTVEEAEVDGYTCKVALAEGEKSLSFTLENEFTGAVSDLTISKEISGNASSSKDVFTFKVIFEDANAELDIPENGLYYSGTLDGRQTIGGWIESGDTFQLKGNGSITIHGVPDGTFYTVTETDSQDYTVRAYNASGTLEGDALAEFINKKSKPVIPIIPIIPKPEPKPDPEPIIPDEPDEPEIPEDLNLADHFAYIIGYPDGTVRPEREITRAEVATIFFRMLTDEARERYWSTSNDFTDVAQGDWYNNAISTLTKVGVINGYPDGTFRPNASITRAEIVKIAVSFFDFVEANDHLFSDVSGHWAEAYIAVASQKGLINGYPDGSFRPDRNVTRAEAVTIINNVLGRKPCKDRLLDEMIFWPDNADEDMWYYEAIQEATNSHEYIWEDLREKLCERWTRLLPVRDWATLERAWAANMAPNPGEVMNNP